MNRTCLRTSGLGRRARSLSLFIALFTALTALAQAPSGYYNSASGLTGQALKDALHAIIDDHQRYPYTSSATDTWDVLSIADRDPGNPQNVITLYKNSSVAAAQTGSAWNREHSWPKSYGFRNDNSCNSAYTDMHHLFAADPSYNSARSNLVFGECDSGCNSRTVVGEPYLNTYAGSGNTGNFEAWDLIKGDLARAMFYMAVRYEGGSHGSTSCSEPDLRLTDDRNLIQSSSSNESVAYMGMLDVLLNWHAQDPVDAVEMARNDVIFSYQGNRNPFVDNPQYVTEIWGQGSGGNNGGGNNGGGNNGGGTGTAGVVWINEIHYDNAGTDSNEGIEVAGPAGTDLSGWQLVAYNGSNGSSYATVNLSGTLADQEGGIGTAWFAISGLQNGAPDGMALVDPNGDLSQFLSWEGSFTASGGPASGVQSEDIGVSEDGNTPVGHSLQLSGAGAAYADFAWETADVHTRDAVNNLQTFVGGSTGGGSDVWINELHYDNSGADSNEGVEVAGPAGSDLSGWQLVAYNGNGGSSYATVNLSGTLADQEGGIGTAWFAISGLQNGAPDGVALVDPNGDVAQFLSWEGTFTANNGPAAGIQSEDIGVSESGGTPVGYSLQLSGTGAAYADFAWEFADAHTRGDVNNLQTFVGGSTGGSDIWINELHYDNTGSDTNEGVEVAGSAGLDLTGYQLIAYNGNGGGVINTTNLSGVLSDQQGGIGTAWFAISGLQNGAPDGVALIDPQGGVVQFLSWEGTFTASSGAASGVQSENIGVSEPSSTPVDYSLQLGGTGATYSDFTWEAASFHTRGAVNNNQTFVGGSMPAGDPWINEIHYDNSGSDVNEGVEIAGPAGTDLNGWQLVGYNGSGGGEYKTVNLSGSLPNTQNGFGQLWFAFSGLQNGSSDGIALIDPNGSVVQFLSYEGVLTATNGPAAGFTSDNIGVSEGSGSSSNNSLQLTGTGGSYDAFTWTGPTTQTRGGANTGQTYN